MNTNRMVLITVLAFVMSLVPSAHAVSGCTNALLNGQFGMQFSGTSAPAVAGGVGGIPVPVRIAGGAPQTGAGSRVPVVGIARFYLDGNGALSGYSMVNLQGVWLQGNVTGTYNVNPDCSASFTVTDSSGNTENFGGTIVGQGDSALVLQTDAGTGVSGTLKRVRGFCMGSDLFGSFGLQYAGATVGKTTGEYSSVGIATFDGQGDVAATEFRYAGGASNQVASTGTVTVNPDCTAVITLSGSGPGANSINFLALVGFDQRQLVFVQSDAGTAASGSLIAQ